MITQLLATWIPALLIALSGVMKLSGNPKLLEGMTTQGVGRYVRVLGVMELAFATLFVSHIQAGVPARVLLLRGRDRDGAVARRLEGESLYPDRAALDRRLHPRPLDLFLRRTSCKLGLTASPRRRRTDPTVNAFS